MIPGTAMELHDECIAAVASEPVCKSADEISPLNNYRPLGAATKQKVPSRKVNVTASGELKLPEKTPEPFMAQEPKTFVQTNHRCAKQITTKCPPAPRIKSRCLAEDKLMCAGLLEETSLSSGDEEDYVHSMDDAYQQQMDVYMDLHRKTRISKTKHVNKKWIFTLPKREDQNPQNDTTINMVSDESEDTGSCDIQENTLHQLVHVALHHGKNGGK